MEQMFCRELLDGICEGKYTYNIYKSTSLGSDPVKEYLTFKDVEGENVYTIPLKEYQAEMLRFLIKAEQEKYKEKVLEIR